jgi:hypothetical protein
MNNIVLIYSSNMQNNNIEFNNDNMEIDLSLNNIEEINPNDTIEELFSYEVEKAIDTGDIKFINNAIKNYGNLLNKSYIHWANLISSQIVQEQIEEMVI